MFGLPHRRRRLSPFDIYTPALPVALPLAVPLPAPYRLAQMGQARAFLRGRMEGYAVALGDVQGAERLERFKTLREGDDRRFKDVDEERDPPKRPSSPPPKPLDSGSSETKAPASVGKMGTEDVYQKYLHYNEKQQHYSRLASEKLRAKSRRTSVSGRSETSRPGKKGKGGSLQGPALEQAAREKKRERHSSSSSSSRHPPHAHHHGNRHAHQAHNQLHVPGGHPHFHLRSESSYANYPYQNPPPHAVFGPPPQPDYGRAPAPYPLDPQAYPPAAGNGYLPPQGHGPPPPNAYYPPSLAREYRRPPDPMPAPHDAFASQGLRQYQYYRPGYAQVEPGAHHPRTHRAGPMGGDPRRQWQ